MNKLLGDSVMLPNPKSPEYHNSTQPLLEKGVS